MKVNSNNRATSTIESVEGVLIRLGTFGLGLIMIPVLGFTSVLSDLAATVEPGEFVELEIDGSVSTCDVMVPPVPQKVDEDGNLVFDDQGNPVYIRRLGEYGNILEFTDEALWNPVDRGIYIQGTRRPYQRWDQAFVKYSETTNSWTTLDRPPFNPGFHGYDHAAIDVVRQNYYWSQVGQSRLVWQMNIATGLWRQLPNVPIQNTGQFSALEYFPELDRLVFFDGLDVSEYALYNPVIDQWEGPFSLADTPFGAISHFSEYNPTHGVMFFGGGFHYTNGGQLPDPTPDINEQRRFYMLDQDQDAHRLADPPTFLGQFGAGPVQTIDPSTGNLVVFQGKPNPDSTATCPSPGPLPIWEYDLLTDIWTQTGTQTLTSLYCAMNTVAVPLYEYGVIFITSVRSDTNCKVFLYRHSPSEPSPPSITTQPASQSAEEGSSVTFSLAVSGSGPLEYQWYRDDVLIAEATSSSFTIEPVTIGDDGAQYHSTVTNNLGNAVSNYAILNVILDITAPLIAGASVRSPDLVDIQFSEVVSTISAQTVANYQISGGIQVTDASLNSDGKTAHLQTASLEPDTVYTVTINNIQDVSAAANEILPDSTIETMFAPVMNFDDGMLPFEWIPLTESRWSVVENGNNNALFLNTTDYPSLSGSRLGEYILSPDSYGDFTLTVEAKTNEPSGNGNADYALVFGFQDENNYYYMLFNRTMTNTTLSKITDGTRENLVTATNNWLIDDEYHTVEVRRVLDDIEVRFDGNIVLEYTDGTFPIGQIGLGSFNDSSYFDDIRITTGTNTVIDVIFVNGFE